MPSRWDNSPEELLLAAGLFSNWGSDAPGPSDTVAACPSSPSGVCDDRRVPHSVADLLSLLELERLEVDLFRGRQPDTARQRVFGGQVAAQSLAAASQTVEAGSPVHSMHAYFL